MIPFQTFPFRSRMAHHTTYNCPCVVAPINTFHLAGLVLIQRTADGARGWVPGAIVKEVHSDHMRARNFKQRYQFLKALAELDMADT